jgi:hypothetical protein
MTDEGCIFVTGQDGCVVKDFSSGLSIHLHKEYSQHPTILEGSLFSFFSFINIRLSFINIMSLYIDINNINS